MSLRIDLDFDLEKGYIYLLLRKNTPCLSAQQTDQTVRCSLFRKTGCPTETQGLAECEGAFLG